MAATYDPSVISFIPSLEEARTATKSDNFQTFLSLFENIAKVQKQNDRYGVTLVHRHTEVEASHRNFDFKQTLQPFPLSDDAQDLYGAEIRPKSYALREMSWKPYEFEIGAYDDSANEFFAAVGQLLQQYQLADYIGLRRYSPDDPEELEITERKGISVKVPWNSTTDGEVKSQDYKTTFWGFPSGDGSGEPKNDRCSCNNLGTTENPNHNHIDKN